MSACSGCCATALIRLRRNPSLQLLPRRQRLSLRPSRLRLRSPQVPHRPLPRWCAAVRWPRACVDSRPPPASNRLPPQRLRIPQLLRLSLKLSSLPQLHQLRRAPHCVPLSRPGRSPLLPLRCRLTLSSLPNFAPHAGKTSRELPIAAVFARWRLSVPTPWWPTAHRAAPS